MNSYVISSGTGIDMNMESAQQNSLHQPPQMHPQTIDHSQLSQLNHPSMNHQTVTLSQISQPPQMNISMATTLNNNPSQINHSTMNNSTLNTNQLQQLQIATTSSSMQPTQIVVPQQRIDPSQMNQSSITQAAVLSIMQPAQVSVETPPMNNDKSSATKEPNPDLTCEICNKTYDNKRFLNYHYTSTHKTVKKNIKCAYSLQSNCNESFRIRKDYEDHLISVHKCILAQENIVFNDLSDFESWKTKMEDKTNSKFILVRGGNKYKDGELVRGYKCSHSGEKQAGEKKSKTKQQNIGVECPAYIRANITESKVEVTFISTHIGHSTDTGTFREARKRIEQRRIKLQEKRQQMAEMRKRQEKLTSQRSEIIRELHNLDLSATVEEAQRIEKLFQMFKLSLEMFHEANAKAEDNQDDDDETVESSGGDTTYVEERLRKRIRTDPKSDPLDEVINNMI